MLYATLSVCHKSKPCTFRSAKSFGDCASQGPRAWGCQKLTLCSFNQKPGTYADWTWDNFIYTWTFSMCFLNVQFDFIQMLFCCCTTSMKMVRFLRQLHCWVLGAGAATICSTTPVFLPEAQMIGKLHVKCKWRLTQTQCCIYSIKLAGCKHYMLLPSRQIFWLDWSFKQRAFTIFHHIIL